MNATLPLRRVCLEVDRALRERPFFARTLRDDLDDDAAVDFVRQLGALVTSVAPEWTTRRLVLEDVTFLEGGRPIPARPECAAVGPFRAAVASYRRLLGPDVVHWTGLTVFGTSWALDAAAGVTRRTRRAPSLLSYLSREGPSSLNALEAQILDGVVDGPCIFAFAELSRGALLGLSADLESTWPAPMLVRSFVLGEED